jgi:hypothetical protein
MPRYVILEHDWPQRHWDFMLETGTVLQTWKLAEIPKPGARIPAGKSFDHRLIYLDYEGTISGGRGSVTRWDAGRFFLVAEQENRLVVRLEEGQLQGTVELTNHLKEGWIWQLDVEPASSETNA